MKLSLENRFRGALLGAALGEILGANCCDRLTAQSSLSWLEVSQWGFGQFTSSAPFGWGKLAIQQIQYFVQEEFQPGSRATPESDLAIKLPPPDPHLFGQNGGAGIAIAALPIALFYHEDSKELHYCLEQAMAQWHPPTIAGVWVISHIISLALREQPHPNQWVDQLITDLEPDTTIVQQLAQIQHWLEQRAGLATVQSLIQEISSEALPEFTPIVMAIYSFLSTPEDFRLSLLRTARMLHQPQIACAIAGAISGAYNGVGGLPIDWRQSFTDEIGFVSSLQQLWHVSSETELFQHADRLFAVWSGRYDPYREVHFPQFVVTASPNLIRPQ